MPKSQSSLLSLLTKFQVDGDDDDGFLFVFMGARNDAYVCVPHIRTISCQCFSCWIIH